MERAIIRRLEYEATALPRIEQAKEEMAKLESTVYAVADPMEREVLRLRYMDGETFRHPAWREIAAKIYGDDDDCHVLAVYRLHWRVLQTIGQISK